MKPRAIHIYVAIVTATALVCLALLDWHEVTRLPREHLFGLAALIALGLISEALALRIQVGNTSGNSTITFIPLLASVLLFGPTAAVLLMGLTGFVGEFAIRRKEGLKGLFNISQWIVATFLASWVFLHTGGVPYLPAEDFSLHVVPFLAFWVVFSVLNNGAVSLAFALSENLSSRRVWSFIVGRSGTNLFYDLLISPIAIVVAFLYAEASITGLILILLPLLFIRHSYLTTFKLQQANRDLLKALVKAIETRDPYTSGHSLRVSKLAVDIAEQYGLNGRHIEAIEQAALLHDIGKIDIVYSEILKKPASLTDEEREIIESHVTKGIELLKSLSSFPTDVILAIRHHHERIDGNGYPDGLCGTEIPLGARIIKVCDAIDAMLSDRPYRDALDISEVVSQLQMFSGIQFDGSIVECISPDILEEHRKDIQADKEQNETIAEVSLLDPGGRLEARIESVN